MRRGPAGPRTLCNACGLMWANKVSHFDNKYGFDETLGSTFVLQTQVFSSSWSWLHKSNDICVTPKITTTSLSDLSSRFEVK